MTGSSSSSPQPTLRYPSGCVVCPGDRLGTAQQASAGPGSNVLQNGHLYASVVGNLQVVKAEEDSTIPFQCHIQTPATKPLASSHVPQVGQLVIGKVLRITPQNAVVQMLILEGVGTTPFSLEGAIRMEDVQSAASESIQNIIPQAFSPGDIVACRILSVGDSRRYALTTAQVELGVLQATCHECQNRLKVQRWNEMKCPVCDNVESRKCAKPFNFQELVRQETN